MARIIKQSIMTRQAEMVAWACEVIEPLRPFKVENLKIKHNADAGCYDFTYNDGVGVFATGNGVPVDVQLLHAGNVERYLFAKDCEELLSRNVRDVLHFDYGMVKSLHHALKMNSDGKILLLGEGVTFELLQNAVNAQIRALTKGDITKEKEVLSLDTWRALTELDAQSREYEEISRRFPSY